MRAVSSTIAGVLRFDGIGLHSGRHISMRLEPAAPRSGIVFHVSGREIPAAFDLVRVTPLCTALGAPTAPIHRANAPIHHPMAPMEDHHGVVQARTVEHLLAALLASSVTDCGVVLEGGDEVPVLDGSCAALCAAIKCARCAHDDGGETTPIVRVKRRVEVRDEKRKSVCTLEPLESEEVPTLDVAVQVDDFGGRLPCTEVVRYVHRFGETEDEWFDREVAPARTFGFAEDVKAMRENGLGLGGSLENCVVFLGDGSARTLNSDGLRFGDEWARHKLLDCLGDAALSMFSHGVLHGRLRCFRPGHYSTNQLLRRFFSDPSNYDLL